MPGKSPLDFVDEEQTYVLGPDGQRRLIGIRQDIPEMLATGERRYVRRTTLVAAADGRLIDPENPRLVACGACGRYPIHDDATRRCARCEAIVCLPCAGRLPPSEDPMIDPGPLYLCNPCARQARRRELWAFLFSVR